MNKIILDVNEHNIINGTLFYCVEHFLYLSKYTNINLCIIFNNNINIIKNIIKEKYFITNDELDNIIQIKSLDLLKTNTNKAMILDSRTYNIILPFASKINKIFLYSNDNNHNARNKDNIYGFYKYQKFNIKERLKLGFQFMKPKIPHINKTFCSHLLKGSIDKKLIENTATYNVSYKNFSKDLDIFKCKEIIYYHTKELDRNNRIIPEAFYFGNKLTLINNTYTKDSINERYYICLHQGYKVFQINEDYKLTKDFLVF